MRATLAALALAASWGEAAAHHVAPADCPQRAAILELADGILAGRHDLNRFAARRFGTEAAYLTIHYGGLSDEAARKRLDGWAAEGGFVRIDEMSEAFAILREGASPSAEFRFDAGSVLRARALTEEGPVFVPSMAEKPALPSLDAFGLADALADLDDARRERVAARAEAHGQIGLALVLRADQDDLTALRETIARHPDHPILARPSGLNAAGVGYRQPVPITAMLGGTALSHLRQHFEVARAGRRLGSDGVRRLVNLTGGLEPIAAAAATFNAAVDAGELDPIHRRDEARRFVRDRLLALSPGLGMAEGLDALEGGDLTPPTDLRQGEAGGQTGRAKLDAMRRTMRALDRDCAALTIHRGAPLDGTIIFRF